MLTPQPGINRPRTIRWLGSLAPPLGRTHSRSGRLRAGLSRPVGRVAGAMSSARYAFAMPKWPRGGLVLGLILSSSWGLAADAAARIEITGGPAVVSTTEAPWSVLIEAHADGQSMQCSGSILDATHILTAAHCTFDEATQQRISPREVTVTAGV